MTDGVKFIFKTLIKVPVIIAAAYGIFNIFAFCFIYFKMLGLSYVVMQTAVENNYLPEQELTQIYNYVKQMEDDIYMIENADIIVGVTDEGNYVVTGGNMSTDSTGDEDARKKIQYGKVVTVGVTCDYKFIWPLDYRAAGDGVAEKVDGLNNQSGNVDLGFSNEALQQAGTSGGPIETNNNISIVYTVPGLKYYPDLEY